MPVTIKDDSIYWTLSNEATIYQAAALKTELLSILETKLPITLDLSEVKEFDTAGLQIILIAKQSSAQLGVNFTVANKTSVVSNTLNLMGVAL
jgi:anti-anti-sigma regulatory factor